VTVDLFVDRCAQLHREPNANFGSGEAPCALMAFLNPVIASGVVAAW
jgi:hypothetical protein